MGNALWLAIGFFLIFEGLGPMLIPEKWRNTLKEMGTASNKSLRTIGGSLATSGLVIVFMMWPAG